MSNSIPKTLLYSLIAFWLFGIKACKPKDEPASETKIVVVKPDKFKIIEHINMATGQIAEKSIVDNKGTIRGSIYRIYLDGVYTGRALYPSISQINLVDPRPVIAPIVGKAEFDTKNVKNLSGITENRLDYVTGNNLVVRFIRDPNTAPGPNNDWYHTDTVLNGNKYQQNYRPDTLEFLIDNFKFETTLAETKEGFDKAFKEGAVDWQKDASLRNFSSIKQIDSSTALFRYVK